MITFAQHVVDALTLSSLIALFALGIALVFGVMQLANFAHGELIMVGAYSAYYFDDLPGPLMIVCSVISAVLLALVIERVAFRPLRGATPATLLVGSFAVSFLLQSLAILIIGSRPRSTNGIAGVTRSIKIGDLSISMLSVVTLVATLALLAGLGWFLARTALGRQLRACAEDFRMARLLGVRANLVIASAFAISGLLAGVASLLYVSQTGTVTPALGLSPVIFGLMAAVVGGLGSLTGAVLGGFLLGAISVTLQVVLPLELRPYRDALLFAMILAIMVVRPQGVIVPSSVRTRI